MKTKLPPAVAARLRRQQSSSSRYENTPTDIREDQRGAKRLGLTPAQYERTPQDRREDAAGQRRLNNRGAPTARK
jgi:hypothetical protein